MPQLTCSDPAPTAAALLPGWKAVGCSVDQALPNRYLGFAAYNNPANTISMCVQKCEESKFTSAGLQAGSLCYCGNATAPPNMAPDGDCSIRCPDDIWSFCGGNWRSSLFSKVDLSKAAPVAIPAPEAPADWKNLGCHQEPWGQRAINGSSASMPTMTVGKCIAYCVDKGFTFAGMSLNITLRGRLLIKKARNTARNVIAATRTHLHRPLVAIHPAVATVHKSAADRTRIRYTCESSKTRRERRGTR